MNIFETIAQKVKDFVFSEPQQKTIDRSRVTQLNDEFSRFIQKPSRLTSSEIVRNLETINKPAFSQNFTNSSNSLHQQFTDYFNKATKGAGDNLEKFNSFLTNPSTPIGWVGGYPKRIGDAMANQAIGGFEQMKSQTPSKIPFTDKTISPNVAGVAKILTSPLAAFGMGSMIAGDSAEALTQPFFSKDSMIPPLLNLGVALAVPGNEKNDMLKAQRIAEKLEEKTGTFSKLQEAFRSLPKEKRLKYLVGKMSQDDLRLTAPQLWEKIEKDNITNLVTKFVDEKGIDVKTKVGILDYLRTPSTVFNKIGLKNEFNSIRLAHDTYLDELPKEINKITDWFKQVPDESSNKLIFQYLDGKAPEQYLNRAELKVATEIKSYLSSWADKLKLPKESRISNYITHIFNRGDIEKEFDPEFAKLIRDKVAGSTYNPFLEKRSNTEGYIENTWQALDAYTKRAVRKFYMDPALEKVKVAADDLESSQFNYIKSFIDRVQMRPTDIDNLLDNAIKASPIGYKYGQRPTAVITQKARQAVYRGLIGLNPASALRNLSQASNTYAELGEKYTFKGYAKVVKNLRNFITGADTELEKVGVLKNSFIEDRTLNATRQSLEKLDQGLFYMFNLAEKINRGGAYFGAKAKALDKGMSEIKAIDYAKSVVLKTQYAFGSIDSPLALQSDIAKTLLQFQSFGVKQAEFLGNKVAKKEYAGLIRYIASSLFFTGTIGKAVGMTWDNMVPFNSGIGTPPTLQLPKGIIETATGNENGPKDLLKGGISYIPAGGELYKVGTGIQSQLQGGVYGPSGNLKYPSGNAVQDVVFGPNVGQHAKDYYNNPQHLGANQTDNYRSLVEGGMSPADAYATTIENRTRDKSLEKDIAGETSFNLFDLLKEKVFGSTKKTSNSRGDLLLDTLDKQSKVSDQVNEIKQIFQSGLSKDKVEKLLEKRGLPNYEESSFTMMKTLPIDNGSRGNYLVSFLSGMSGQNYVQTVYKLAENEVLTTGVTAKWLDDGLINENQQKALNKIISSTKGKTIKSSGNGLSSIRKISVSAAKVVSPKRISPATSIKFGKPLLEEYNSGAFLSGFKTKL